MGIDKAHRSLKWLSILLVTFLLSQKAYSDPEPEQLSLPFAPRAVAELAPELKSKILAAYKVVSSRDTTASEKTAVVNDFFTYVDDMCVNHCDILIGQLKTINDNLRPEGRATVTAPGINSILPEGTPAGIADGLAGVAKFSSNLEKMYNKNPQLLIFRMRAGIEAIRTLVGFEQQAMFKLLSKDPQERTESAKELRQDMVFLFRQGQALMKIVAILRDHKMDSEEKFSKEEVTGIIDSISQLGIFYIKLAQSVSNMSSAIPSDITDSLRMFQDSLAPMSEKEAREILTSELGKNPEEIFVDLDLNNPISSGSIACVYDAKVRNALANLEPVVIKIQRPGLQAQLDYNRRFNKLIMKALNVVSLPSIAPIMDVVSNELIGLEDSFEGELDFRKEMRNLNRFSWLFSLDKNIRIPKAYRRYSTSKVLVMEKLEGINLQDAIQPLVEQSKGLIEITKQYKKPEEIEALTEKYMVEHPEVEILEKMFGTILSSTFYMTVVVGELHSDLHPGNILADIENGKYAYIDFAQTVKTNGLVTQPLWAGIQMFRGNINGFSNSLKSMCADPQFSLETIQRVVTEVFAANKIQSITIRGLTRDGQKLNDLGVLRKALGEIIARLYQKEGYRATSRYFQFMRSFLPVASSLVMMGRAIPPLRIAKIALQAFFKGYVWGSVKRLALYAPAQFGEFHNQIATGLAEISQNRDRRKARKNEDQDCVRLLNQPREESATGTGL